MHHVLGREFYQDSLPGRTAIAILGDEPAHELFLLLMDILCVAMTGRVSCDIGGETISMTLPEDPLFFEKPFYPRTMKIVGDLVEKGFLDFQGENEHGIAYTLKIPTRAEARAAWCKAAMDEICKEA
jgi:hypothetical protein